MKNKKIVIVSPSLKMGGIERALSVLANFFCEKNYDVYFISCLSGDKFYELNNEINFIEPNFKNLGGIKKVYFYIKILFFLRKEIIRIHPDVILSFGDWFNPLVLFSLLGLKYPVYISDRTSPDYKFNIVTSFGKKILYPMSSGFIAQTQRAADYKINQFGNKLNIKIIPNAIKGIEVYEIPKKKWVLCLARLSWEKGPDRLLKAFSLIEDRKGWQLIFAGSGPMMESLKKMAKDLNIKDEVLFLGQVKNVDYLLAESAFFVLPSHLEGFPNALCEAMAAGLPAICFDTIPYENIIVNNENGFVVKDNNLNDLASKISFLINNPEKRIQFSRKAEQIKEKLAIEKIGEMYLSFMFNIKK